MAAWVEGLAAAVEPPGVFAAGDPDAAHAVPARRLERVVGADDVRAQDHFPRAFDGEAAEMHDGRDALGHAQHVAQARAVAPDELLARRESLQRPHVGEPQLATPRTLPAQIAADLARPP